MSMGRSSHRLAALVVVVLGAAGLAAPATARAPREPAVREPGNGPERNAVAATDTAPQALADSRGGSVPGSRAGYPRQTRLRGYPENPNDKSIKLGLMPYHGIAPALNDLQARSDRVSAEVIGESALGRDLYLVTVTAPESAAQARRQDRWRAMIEDAPWAAARDRELRAGYKAPVWINANIHGDEWEGTDGSMRVIERLATATDPATVALLRRTRVYFTVTNNPDGRIAGTRANGAGFNINRDYITGSQPEARAIRAVARDARPLVMLDEHGYTGTTLIEPSSAPHGQNYDYDLYIRHAYANALGMERAIQALGHPETTRADIPFRDYDPGDWDDWPPIFTPMYAIYHGAVGHTVEVPMRVNGSAYETLPVVELRRRSAINTDVAAATIGAAIEYTDRNRASLVAGQIELFRRGWAGEPQRHIPDGFVPGFGPEDRYSTDFPRSYVIPAGSAAAARLVDHLVVNDVRVTRARASFRFGGRGYPAGTYIVDMHQPKRGLANAILETGRDLSGLVPQMYDISGWSHRLLWGASVHIGHRERPRVPVAPVVVAAPTGGVFAPHGQPLRLTLTDGADLRAVNALLAAGVRAYRRADGSIVVPASARAAALRVADQFGVRFSRAPAGPPGVALRRPVLAAAIAADELFAVREMGFEVRPVSTAVLNAGFDYTGVTTLFVSSGLSYPDLNAPARAALDAFLARGGVITRGATGARFNAEAGLLPVRAHAGRSDANGVVAVTGATGVRSYSFAYSPLWFTDLGAGVTADQRYAATGPLVAGHWRAEDDGTGGPDAAAGQAAVVSGRAARGTPTVLFGTEPLFRAHPKGLYAQVGAAILWAGSGDAARMERPATRVNVR